MTEKSEWIGTREAAQILCVRRAQSVIYHIERGHIPSGQKIGNTYMMKRSEVEALKVKNREWLEAHGRI